MTTREFLREAWTGDWIIERTTAKQRRRLHYRLFVLWLAVGTPVWLVERNVLMFVGFMSIYAIWFTHAGGWSAETPVENEEGNE